MMRSFGSFLTLRSIGLEICGGSDGSRTRKNREAFWCILIQPYGQIRLCLAIAHHQVGQDDRCLGRGSGSPVLAQFGTDAFPAGGDRRALLLGSGRSVWPAEDECGGHRHA
jgi:hypothetical protein